MYARRGVVGVYFLQNYNKKEGTGKFIYNPLILDNKQLLKHDQLQSHTSLCKDIFSL